MPVDSFNAFVLDQMSDLPEVRAKAMFGGHGLYQADCFFGIVMDGRLFFKVDDTTRRDFLERGMGPFTYERARRTMAMNYYEVPLEVLENREDLLAWARRAIRVAAASSKKSARKLSRRAKQPKITVEQQGNKAFTAQSSRRR